MIESRFVLLDESLPLLATAIHSGHKLSDELSEHCGISEQDRLREEDPYTNEAAELFPNHITLQSSRFEIDLNRSRERALYLKPDDCWGLPLQRDQLPQRIISSLYEEYDQWYIHLDNVIERLLERHPFIVVLDLHSYNHRRGGADAQPDPQEKNPDIILGRSNLHRKYYDDVEALRLRLDGTDWQNIQLDCRADVKFPGGYMSRYLNAKYGDRLMAVAVEFKKIFMNEWTSELNRHAWDSLKGLFHQEAMGWLGLLRLPFF